MNSAVAINARILTSIISLFFLLRNNSGSNPIEIRNFTPVKEILLLSIQWDELNSDDTESDQYYE